MLVDIIASFFIAGFFFFMYKIGQAFVPKENPISKVFAVGSVILSTFLIGLVITN